jgi:hypothetical protein
MHRLAAFLLPYALLLSPHVARGDPGSEQQTGEQARNEALEARLGHLSPHERSLLSEHLERGPVGLIEFATETELPAVILATRVHAPAGQVAKLLGDPGHYPGFMPALDEVKVRTRRQRTIAYDWSWRTAVFTLRGSNVMTLYEPPEQALKRRGYRIGVRSTRGDLGKGRMMWRVYPETKDRCLLVLAMRVDMRQANYVARKLSAGGNGVNRTINISLGFVMMLSSKSKAEQKAGWEQPDPDGPLPALHPPEVELRKLAPMLRRGDLLLLEMHGQRIAQVAVVGRMGKGRERVHDVMTNPEAFGRALVQGSRAEVVSREDDGVVFEWSIPLPLVGSSGRMRLAEDGHRVSVDGVSGNLSDGRWRFQTHLFPWKEAAVVGWGRFDPADASWLLERLVSGVPWFRHGLTAGSQVMVMRSIRSRVWRRN